MRTHIKSYQEKHYIVSMYRATGDFRKTHKVLTLCKPTKEGGYPIRIRERRVENTEAEELYTKGVNWVKTQARKH